MLVEDMKPGFNLPASWDVRLELLERLYGYRDENPNRYLNVAKEFGPECRNAAAYLVNNGLCLEAGEGHLAISDRGADELLEVRRRREDSVNRRKAARDAVLHWIDRAEGQANPIVERMGSYGRYLGQSFTTQEVEVATRWLRDEGYIEGVGTSEGTVLRPRITTKGQKAVESGRSVNDEGPPRWSHETHNTINVGTASGGAFAAGSNINQTIALDHSQRQQMLELAEYLEGEGELDAASQVREAQSAPEAKSALARVQELVVATVPPVAILIRAIQPWLNG